MIIKLIFWVNAILLITGGLTVVLSKRIICAVIGFLTSMACLGVMFLLLRCEYLALLQILVYAGAIIVMFLFTVLMFGQKIDSSNSSKFFSIIVGIITGLLNIEFIYIFQSFTLKKGPVAFERLYNSNEITEIAKVVIFKYPLAFEILSVLLLSGLIGAIYIAKKEKVKEDVK